MQKKAKVLRREKSQISQTDVQCTSLRFAVSRRDDHRSSADAEESQGFTQRKIADFSNGRAMHVPTIRRQPQGRSSIVRGCRRKPRFYAEKNRRFLKRTCNPPLRYDAIGNCVGTIIDRPPDPAQSHGNTHGCVLQNNPFRNKRRSPDASLPESVLFIALPFVLRRSRSDDLQQTFFRWLRYRSTNVVTLRAGRVWFARNGP